MLQRIKKVLAPPVFPDEEKTRVAGLLNTILIIVMALVMAFCVPALVMTPDIGRVLIELSLAVAAFIILIILRRGRVRLAGFLFTLIIWAIVSYGTYEAGGFRGSVMSAYFGILLIAALLLETWAGIAFGVLSIAVTGWMMMASEQGLLPPPPVYATQLTFWGEFSVTAVGVLGLLTLVMNSLQQALQRARRNEAELEIRMKEIETLAQRAIEANQFKTSLIARVSHELRTPLNAILGLTEMLGVTSERNELSPRQIEITRRIVENSKSLERVFTELLDQSQIDAGQMVINEIPFSPASLLDQISGTFANLAQKKGLTFVSEVDPGLPAALIGDPARIEEIIRNLMGNAIKFTNAGLVQVRLCQGSPGWWDIVVMDTGIGIPASAQGYIFDAFRQVDESATRAFGGVGLGLSIVKQLVNAMNGKIAVSSEPGKGSTFTVSLPLMMAEPVRETIPVEEKIQ